MLGIGRKYVSCFALIYVSPSLYLNLSPNPDHLQETLRDGPPESHEKNKTNSELVLSVSTY